jgi:hypothetical protein
MKLVSFNRAMVGMGNPALVPDEVAARLESQGLIKPNPPDFPEKPADAMPAQPARRPQTYLTKAARRLGAGTAATR